VIYITLVIELGVVILDVQGTGQQMQYHMNTIRTTWISSIPLVSMFTMKILNQAIKIMP
jgi:hypothetical protein